MQLLVVNWNDGRCENAYKMRSIRKARETICTFAPDWEDVPSIVES